MSEGTLILVSTLLGAIGGMALGGWWATVDVRERITSMVELTEQSLRSSHQDAVQWHAKQIHLLEARLRLYRELTKELIDLAVASPKPPLHDHGPYQAARAIVGLGHIKGAARQGLAELGARVSVPSYASFLREVGEP